MTAISSLSNVIRRSLLLLLCGGAIGSLANTIINNPTKLNLQEPAAINFPQNIPLTELTILSSKALTTHTFKNGKLATGMAYQYQPITASATTLAKQPQSVNIEIRYITDGVANWPNIAVQIEEFTKIPPEVIKTATTKEQPGVGEYSLFVDRQTAYFSTCINPRGISTVSGDRFIINNNPNPFKGGVNFDRILPWALGRQTLRDPRCLWTILSTPIDPKNPDPTIKMLETSGVNWVQWWQAHFPAA
jgi:cyanosortase A-associated protein